MWIFFIILIIAVIETDSANILALFPSASTSHQVVFRALTDALEDRGHTLTIVSTDPQRLSRYHVNSTEIDMHFSYDVLKRHFKVADIKDEIDFVNSWVEWLEPMYKEQFECADVKNLLQSRGKVKYDVVIVEFLLHYPWFALAEWFDAPLIGITSLDTVFDIHESFGNVANPILHPEMWLPFIEDLTFKQRFRSLRYYLWYKLIFFPKFHSMNERIIQKYLPGMTSSISKLGTKAELLMTNTHPALGFVRPVLPTTIQLGFLHIKPSKPIIEETLKTFLENSEKPIIYMSLGTNMQSSEMSKTFVNVFLNVFKTLPYNILWKWEADKMENKPDNVFIRKWLPQADLLAHPKIKIFIMQGGQQSMEEAIDRGVPVIVIPFMADQEANAMRVKRLNIGVHLETHSLSEESLRYAIDEIVSGQYERNILKLREIINDQPMKPVEKAVWWVEYCIRHKGVKHLAYNCRNVSFYKRYMLDFIGIAVLILLTTLKLLCLMTKLMCVGEKIKKD